MKKYAELTRLGRIRRLRKLVFKALEQYDLRVKWVKFLIIDTNTMFKIRAEDGEQFVLRIYSDEETTLQDNQAEMFWLDALKRDTDLKLTEPVARRDGDYVTLADVPEGPAQQRCVLFKWVPGRPLENYLNAENYHKYGQMLAKLHEHARTLNPLPAYVNPKRWDKVFYYPDEPVVYNTPDYAHLFPSGRLDLLERVIARADALFAQLFADKDGLMLIHGDLHYWNVHFYRGELYALDFEDISLGYPLQDVAITLSYGQQLAGYDSWRAAFQDGYCSVRAWPQAAEGDIETLMAARSVMFINYVARIDPSPAEYIQERCARLENYLSLYPR